MKLDRIEIAEVLREIGILLELKGENPFKVLAYRNAARRLEGPLDDFAELLREGRLRDLPGIGDALAEKIEILARNGSLPYHRKLRSEFPETLFDLLRVPGLGPKKVRALYENLDVKSLGELECACRENRLVALEGFGLRTQEKVLAGIGYLRRNEGRFLFAEVIDLADSVVGEVSRWKEVGRAALAGSLRRRKETVRDVDIVASSERAAAVMSKFTGLPGVRRVVARGRTKSTVLWENGLSIDLRVVTDREFPYALHHLTGSREHNTAMRARAKAKGLKMNEYGLFRGTRRIDGRDEAAIFRALGLDFIPPELREGLGEIGWAEAGKIPKLLELRDLRGLFHVHTTYSDARNTLAQMVEAAEGMGLEYIGISEHSQSAGYANGLKEADVDRQRNEIAQLRKRHPKLRIFHGIESDIRPDGSLDYPERVLRRFDFVIASVHEHFGMPEAEMTRRCIRALENPFATMLGHPTGRLLLAREGFRIDLGAVIARAAELGKIIELNAHPQRLDLDWRWLGYAKGRGALVAINPDAHSVEGLRDIRFGVHAARKGGLEPRDVLNTLSARKVERILKGTRRG